MIKGAINGFGRIGRLAFREMITSRDFDIVAINTTNMLVVLSPLLIMMNGLLLLKVKLVYLFTYSREEKKLLNKE